MTFSPKLLRESHSIPNINPRWWIVALALLAMVVTTADARADLAPGLYQNLVVFHGGQNRVYDLQVPASYNGSVAVPLVVDLHGFGVPLAYHRDTSGFNAIAEEQNFLVAWPLGLGTDANATTLAGGPGWNAGSVCCGDSLTQNVDDVGFIRAVVESIQGQVAVDGYRIYATGHSNGAALSHRLACEASDLFAAVATFAWPGPPVACAPARPIPILMIHGRQDSIVPYAGGHLFLNALLPSVPNAAAEFEAWRTRNGCSGATPDVTENPGGTNVCQRYTTCTAGVQVGLCSVDTLLVFDDAGHWPYFPRVTAGFNTQQRVWDFFVPEPAGPMSLFSGILTLAALARRRPARGSSGVPFIAVGAPHDLEIDSKPRSATNPVSPFSRGVSPVAVLGSDDFDVNDVPPSAQDDRRIS